MHYWLLKSEPESFGIEHLEKSPQQNTTWEGVRNYQARNLIRQMQVGDQAFFYHSSCKVPGIAGIVTVIKAPYADSTALDPESHYYDPKSSSDNPRWYRVDVKLTLKYPSIITLSELRNVPELSDLVVLRKGNRLSVTPITVQEWTLIRKRWG
jgi:predicted RNA-binding protein with PUA-like domain